MIAKTIKNNIVEKQPYTSQIPFIVDVTDWCKSKCKNDNADTIYHNLYSYDFEKKFLKVEKNVLNYDLVLFQYWVHGDFINEVAPFQSHSTVEEQRKLRKMMPVLIEIANDNMTKKKEYQIVHDEISKLSLIQ